MSEKRKPIYTLLLRYEGKKTSAKVEVFPAKLWTDVYTKRDHTGRDHFRLRINGKWFDSPEGKKQYFTKTQVKNSFFKSIRPKFN